MRIQPANLQDVCDALVAASAQNARAPEIDLSRLNRIVEHTAEDMTATVEAGLTLAAFQAHLDKHRQWLPIDPPDAARLTIGELLSTNASGPRRFGYGTIREYLIGIKVALADGRMIKAGGKVVKNVAGYDLCKLFVGSRGSVGVIVEATFKLRPQPEAETFVQAECESLENAGALLEIVLESELTPVVLDLHNLSGRSLLHPHSLPSAPTALGRGEVWEGGARSATCFIVLGFAGTHEEVDWQLARARDLNLGEPSSLDYETRFWTEEPVAPRHRLSVLPSRLTQAISVLGDVPFVARAGNGMIYYHGGPEPLGEGLPVELMQRVKDAYDPKHILPELPI